MRAERGREWPVETAADGLQGHVPRALPLDPDLRRAHLLRVAREVFAERGYHATGVSDIIARAGVARGTFYNYFVSKRAVFQAVLEALMHDVVEAVEPIDVAQPVAPQLRADLERLVGVLVGMGGAVRILFTDAAAVDAESAVTLREFFLDAEVRLATALVIGQAMGVIRDGDPRIMAVLLIGMLREPVVQAWLHQRPIDDAALVRELEQTLLGGVIRETSPRWESAPEWARLPK
jgi:AcrR family transcriptional regulator